MVAVHYNPSTGEVAFDLVTDKVMVFNTDCEFCTNTPNTLSVVLSNIVSNDGCRFCSLGGLDKAHFGVPDINGTHILTRDMTDPCAWLKVLGNTYTVIDYTSDDSSCTGDEFISTYTDLTLRIRKLVTGVEFAVIATRDGDVIPRLGISNYTISGGCVETINAIPNPSTSHPGCYDFVYSLSNLLTVTEVS